MIRTIAAVLLFSGLSVVHVARAAQSYDNCAGTITTLPATITTQGVWCMKKDLATGMSSGAAITIAANNVTIDCNDFKIGGLAAGNTSVANGIYATERQNATVRHCNVRGFRIGISLVGGAGHLVEDNRLDNNLYTGILVYADSSLVQRNRVYDTGGAPSSGSCAIFTASGSIVDNEIRGVFSTADGADIIGIQTNGEAVTGNRISSLQPKGAGSATGITGGISAVGNQVTADITNTINGIGISASMCANNTVHGFSTGRSCTYSVGNLP